VAAPHRPSVVVIQASVPNVIPPGRVAGLGSEAKRQAGHWYGWNDAVADACFEGRPVVSVVRCGAHSVRASAIQAAGWRLLGDDPPLGGRAHVMAGCVHI
jgi:hypothetical protein